MFWRPLTCAVISGLVWCKKVHPGVHVTATINSLISGILGDDLPIRIEAYNGATVGPEDAPATLVLKNRDALVRLLGAPGELGLVRAYVAGDLEIRGDIYAVLALRDRTPKIRVRPIQVCRLLRIVGIQNLRRLQPPPEEHRTHGRLHSKTRDADAIGHHYDVSNDFYRLVLGPTMTYSCAVFEHESDSLERAQTNKYELISRKLALRPGNRLLDIGCGWGGMVIHAARHHGVRAVGITVSRPQADLAEKRVAEAGLADQIEIRLQDYRDVDDGPFDAISSIGMFEHVGRALLATYFDKTRSLLRPGGRLLNHAISQSGPSRRSRVRRRGFIHNYVFPDGELLEVGGVVSAIQQIGLEVRHVEGLREHYARTLRHWVSNLETNWDEAVAHVGPGRARVWRLYMAASAVSFEDDRIHVDQTLAINTPPDGNAEISLRPEWAGDLNLTA